MPLLLLILGRLAVMCGQVLNQQAPAAGTLVTRTITPAAGVALINGAQTFASWTAPNDGNVHVAVSSTVLIVTGAEVGGAVHLNYTLNGVPTVTFLYAGGAADGTYPITQTVMADPGTTVTITQSSALTAGTATLQAAIVGD